MITPEFAAALRDAGVRWRPAPGDSFLIPQPDLAGQVFTLSEMTIEAHEYPTGTVLGFNGTTEWALDSVAQEEALWLPREDQLRELLGGAFLRLTRRDDPDADRSAFEVEVRVSGSVDVHHGEAAADAYARALLALVQHASAPPG